MKKATNCKLLNAVKLHDCGKIAIWQEDYETYNLRMSNMHHVEKQVHKLVNLLRPKGRSPIAACQICCSKQDPSLSSLFLVGTIHSKAQGQIDCNPQGRLQTVHLKIKVPRSTQHVLCIDYLFWVWCNPKEKNAKSAYEFLQLEKQVPVGYEWIPLNMVFMLKCTWLARLIW